MYKIENFSFTYPKDKKIIKDISFEIAKLLESDYPHISYDYKKIYIATLNEAASLFLLKFK